MVYTVGKILNEWILFFSRKGFKFQPDLLPKLPHIQQMSTICCIYSAVRKLTPPSTDLLTLVF